MTFSLENPKESTTKKKKKKKREERKTLLELINEFSNFAGYKVNTQKSILFLFASNKQSEIEIKTILLAIASKRIKSLGIN